MVLHPSERLKRRAARGARIRTRLTRNVVWWGGVGACVASMVMFNGSHVLYVQLKGGDATYAWIVTLIDLFAIVFFVTGCLAIVVSHWFPDPRRKRLWQRRL